MLRSVLAIEWLSSRYELLAVDVKGIYMRTVGRCGIGHPRPIGCARHHPAPDISLHSRSTLSPTALSALSRIPYEYNGDLEKLRHEYERRHQSVYTRSGNSLVASALREPRLHARRGPHTCQRSGACETESLWEHALLPDIRERACIDVLKMASVFVNAASCEPSSPLRSRYSGADRV